jgi:hypothetical protein
MLKAISDVENVFTLAFEVSETLSTQLDDLRSKLDAVDPKQPGQRRYEAARELGCGASVAKGAKYRSLLPDRIFIPRTEIRQASDKVRIPALKLTIPDPPPVDVKGVVFVRQEGAWAGQLEVEKLAA